MKEPSYVIEREYLGIISVKEFMGAIIENHNDSSSESRQPEYVMTVEKVLDV